MRYNTVANNLLTMKELLQNTTLSSYILIVDDDLAIREMLEMLLEGEGYEVVLASNGAEALETIRQHRPALVLLDLMMPVMDGWQFLENLKNKPEYQDLPVVLLSANRELTRTARNYNVKAYLSKPFEMNQLLSCVEHYRHSA